MTRTLTASDRSRLIRLASTLPVGHPERKAILAGLNKQGATLREVKTVLHRAGLLNHCELGGRGKDWEIECPDEGVMKLVSKALQKARIPWGGYRTGYGAWVMREEYQSKGDWNDPYSKHHYASKIARGYPPAIESLMADMQRIQGVEDVYVTDTWKDGYHQLRVVLKPQPGKTPWGGMTNTGTFDIRTTARGGYSTVYNFPLYPKIIRAVRTLVKRSGLSLDGIEGLKKVYEYQDAYDRASGEPKKGGYSDNEISVEVYV